MHACMRARVCGGGWLGRRGRTEQHAVDMGLASGGGVPDLVGMVRRGVVDYLRYKRRMPLTSSSCIAVAEGTRCLSYITVLEDGEILGTGSTKQLLTCG